MAPNRQLAGTVFMVVHPSTGLSLTKPKNFGPFQRVPVIANATFRQAGNGFLPFQAVAGKHRHPVHLPIPFAAQHRTGPQIYGPPVQVHGTLT